MQIQSRKLKHVDACLRDEVNYQTRSTGFEHYDLSYNALPESHLGRIDTSCSFIAKRLSAPVLIGAMTGGAEKSRCINQNLALAAEELGLGLMLGSQRVMLELPEARASFAVRNFAPNILLIGNLGAAQLNKGYSAPEITRAIESIEADALAIHTNPLQEALQASGDEDFSALLPKLSDVLQKVPYPLILKEVGHGLSSTVVKSVKDLGFAALDVAGAGGTSWARVEELVRYGEIRHPELVEWGIPTAKALADARHIAPKQTLIASGGIRSGLDIAKALAMGADYVAIARPLLAPALDSAEAVIDKLNDLISELKIVMHCAGAKDLKAIKQIPLIPA